MALRKKGFQDTKAINPLHGRQLIYFIIWSKKMEASSSRAVSNTLRGASFGRDAVCGGTDIGKRRRVVRYRKPRL